MAVALASNATSEVLEGTRASKNPLDATASLMRLVLTLIVMLVGVPGNCLILRVYWTKIRKTSTHVLVMALAWADLAVCALRLFTMLFALLLFANYNVKEIYVASLPFQNAAVATSVLFTTLIAADRYDCVCRPQRRFFTPRRAKILVSVASLLATICNVPDLLADFHEAPTSDILETTVLVGSVFSFAVALVVIAVCYGKVFATIRKHVRVGAAVQRSTRDERGSMHRDIELPTRPTQPIPISPETNDNLQTVSGDKVEVPTVINEPNSDFRNLVPKNDAVPNQTGQGSSQGGNSLDHQSGPGKCATAETGMFTASGDRRYHQEQANGHALQRAGAAVLQRKTTRMLFITSVVFLLTWLPYWVYVAMEIASFCGVNIDPDSVSLTYGFAGLLFANHAANPIIYGLANRRFRTDCKKVLIKIRCC
ncbi:gastrin/cholecystokinin type B receptor-like [Patiria miniata]|uniref:G-protein coupled receptors family 1 profile domain-containing protein n=1 Tax=Patiria miniata TaxID=46514 RepID=A0A913ZQN3_PATMI|nr:gastrin/cholecystokinin type B receptor-like [Patiria miniata]